MPSIARSAPCSRKKAVTDKHDRPETTVTAAGRMSGAHFGAVNTPVYRASTILFPDLASMKPGGQPYSYGRRGTPTSKSLEDAIRELEGGAEVVLVPSGLNACTTAILSMVASGDHLLVTDSVYGPTRLFCDTTLKRLGVETSYFAPDAEIGPLLRPNTRAVFRESPGSLTFEIQDIPAIAKAAHVHGASVLMDNTWATPLLFDAHGHGVDLSIQAGTKYLGGHADVNIGYVSANQSHAARLRETHGNMGLAASGDDCFLALRGLRTLAVRLKRHQETALALTQWLRGRPEVVRILYPALPGDPGHALWKRDFKGACGLFGFELVPVPEAAVAAFVEGMHHFGIGYSWGGFESLILPSHIQRTAAPFRAKGPLIRIHAGLEDPGDLIADLDRGFARLKDAT
ncbi:MAG: cystathionine beta-lyase [Alphaproteobacteria bacterium]|nr:cystathionine beta-lyase [Alphaproteobacteria bacterium]